MRKASSFISLCWRSRSPAVNYYAKLNGGGICWGGIPGKNARDIIRGLPQVETGGSDEYIDCESLSRELGAIHCG